ncbi:cupin domain-containing protein, partial [Spirillospora sp. NPDC029432]
MTDLEQLIDGCIASRDSRLEDWDTLGFQAKAGEEFKRAQIRYIGSGATGDHESDSRILPSEHFTFSNMRLPAGAIGPEHTHHDVEE